VAWLETRPLRKAIARAMQEGTVEVVGAFHLISPAYPGGWIVRVTSIYKRTWNIAISPLMTGGKNPYWVRIIPKILWKHWAGRTGGGSLCNGDHPDEYRRLKDAENNG